MAERSYVYKPPPDVYKKIFNILEIIVIVIWLPILLIYFSTADMEQDTISATPDGYIMVTEAKTFLGGVWFHRDVLKILPDEFHIKRNSFFSESDPELEKMRHHEEVKEVRATDFKISDNSLEEASVDRIPYNKVKRIILERGLNMYSVIIESEDTKSGGDILNDRHTIYFANHDNFEMIKNKITGIANKRFPIIEQSTFLSRFSSSKS